MSESSPSSSPPNYVYFYALQIIPELNNPDTIQTLVFLAECLQIRSPFVNGSRTVVHSLGGYATSREGFDLNFNFGILVTTNAPYTMDEYTYSQIIRYCEDFKKLTFVGEDTQYWNFYRPPYLDDPTRNQQKVIHMVAFAWNQDGPGGQEMTDSFMALPEQVGLRVDNLSQFPPAETYTVAPLEELTCGDITTDIDILSGSKYQRAFLSIVRDPESHHYYLQTSPPHQQFKANLPGWLGPDFETFVFDFHVSKPGTSKLIQYLKFAAQLEQSLMELYLYAAYRLKTAPVEFNGPRASIQFEKTRTLKGMLIRICQEEMAHLHYVQCLLANTALKAQPHFKTFPYNLEGTSRVINQWKIETDTGEFTAKLQYRNLEQNVSNFITFESASLNQVQRFDPMLSSLYDQVRDTFFQTITDETTRATMKNVFYPVRPSPSYVQFSDIIPSPVVDVFNTIGEFYESIITQFQLLGMSDQVLIPQTNRQNFFAANAAIGFYPYRGIAPYTDYVEKTVTETINFIINEGEGYAGAPDESLMVKSHFFIFSFLNEEIQFEQSIDSNYAPSREAVCSDPEIGTIYQYFNACYLVILSWLPYIYGTELEPEKINLAGIVTWPLMSQSIRPFLELTSVFEIQENTLFRVEKEFLPDDENVIKLYNLYLQNSLATVGNQNFDPTQIFGERQQACYDTTLNLGYNVLNLVSEWAVANLNRYQANPSDLVINTTGSDDPERYHRFIFNYVTNRLYALYNLREFSTQLDFARNSGDSSYLGSNAIPMDQLEKYEEKPTNVTYEAGTPILHLKLLGDHFFQLGTDPDPSVEEIGTNGKLRIVASDENYFNRAVIYNPDSDACNMVRRPFKSFPIPVEDFSNLQQTYGGYETDGDPQGDVVPVKVKVRTIQSVESTIIVAGQDFNPITDNMNKLPQTVTPVQEPPSKFRLDMLRRDDWKLGEQIPHYVGENHIIWKDGEPLDPCILKVFYTDSNGDVGEVTREVFNDNKQIIDMTPIERATFFRGPTDYFVPIDEFPGWVINDTEQGFDTVQMYMQDIYLTAPILRSSSECARNLVDGRIVYLNSALTQLTNSSNIDGDTTALREAVGLLGRMNHLGLFNFAFLDAQYIFKYSHTISGDFRGSNSFTVTDINGNTYTPLTTSTRGEKNGRWLVSSGSGFADDDAFHAKMYLDIYIPLQPSTSE